MAEEQNVTTPASTTTPSIATPETQPTAATTPLVLTGVSTSPDGRWQSTLSVNLQLTCTWGELTPATVASVRGSDDPPPKDDTKAGLGDDDPPPKDNTKAGLGDDDPPPKDTTKAGLGD